MLTLFPACSFPGILYAVYFSYNVTCARDDDGVLLECTEAEALEEENDRIELAWRVCVTANFLTGIINIALGFCGEFLLQYFPVGT